MNDEEFALKLDQILKDAEFKLGKPIESILHLKTYLKELKQTPKRTKPLKSLRGIF